MPEAVGVIQTMGFPAILATADAVVKAARVTLVFFDKAEKAQFMIVFRGPVSEVKAAMDAGLEAAETAFGGQVMTHYLVPNPPPNVVDILPLAHNEISDVYRM